MTDDTYQNKSIGRAVYTEYATGEHAKLADRLNRKSVELLGAVSDLSPMRARELAAAWIYRAYLDFGRSLERLEKAQELTDMADCDLYDSHVNMNDHVKLHDILVEWTGSRTLADDAADLDD